MDFSYFLSRTSQSIWTQPFTRVIKSSEKKKKSGPNSDIYPYKNSVNDHVPSEKFVPTYPIIACGADSISPDQRKLPVK